MYTDVMLKIHTDYLRKFGTERYKKYLVDLGILCFGELGLNFDPLKHTFDEICQFLTNNNLWYTMYL